jgi:hypothetical protein
VLGPPVDLVHQQPGVAPLCDRDNTLQLLSNASKTNCYVYIRGLDVKLYTHFTTAVQAAACTMCPPTSDSPTIAVAVTQV